DRDECGPQPDRPRAYREGACERRTIAAKVACRGVDPGAEVRRDVRLAGEGQPAAVAPATQERARAAPLVEHETTDHHVGAWGHQALEPVGAARSGDVAAVTALGHDALELVLGDDVEERLAVVLEVLGHDEALLREGPRAEPFAPRLERQAEQRPVIVVEEIEGHDQRALAAFARLGPQPA